MSLIDIMGGPGGDLVGLWRLSGGGPTVQGRTETQRILRPLLHSPERLRTALEHFHHAGYRAVVTMGEMTVFEALGKSPAGIPVPIPIVPNLQGFMREAVEYGMLGAGFRRAWRVGPIALAGLGLRSVGRVDQLAKRDFPTMLRSFVELELADFARYKPPLVFLQAQVTDLALAMRNPRILQAYAEAVQSRTGAKAGLMTANFGALVASLKSWEIETDAVLTPWNPLGHHMRPTAAAVEQAMKACSFPIWVDRLGWAQAPSAAERAAMLKLGLAGFVRDDLALWCAT